MDLRLLEASPDCMKLISLDGVIGFMNMQGRCMLEIDDQGAVVGRAWSSLWPPEGQSHVAKALAEARAGRNNRFFGFAPTARGTPRWWDVVVSPIYDDTGNIEAILAQSRDITELKEIERTLADSEAKLRALADTVPQLAWMADQTGAVYWYNQRWFDYTGTTFENMRGFGWKAVHHPDHLDRVVEKFLAALDRGEEWEDVFPLRGADGEYRWFLSRARPQRDAQGRIALYCGTNTDITDQRAQSQRLRQLARIVDLSHEAILVWDFDHGIQTWNRGCEELYGYSKSEALGANSHQLLQTIHPSAVAEFEAALLTEGSWSGELRHLAADGSEVWVDSRQEVIRIAGRHIVLETNRDITERRRADEVRNLLVAELNHRIKNTLAIVQSIAAQTARAATGLDDFVSSFNGRIQSMASAHTVLTDSDWVGASVGDLVKSQLSILGGSAARFDCSGPDVFLVPQTALQLTLILHELSTNALKYGPLASPTGKIDIHWALEQSDPPALSLVWRERGGAPVAKPTRLGFGMTLIERSARLPNINARVEFAAEGIIATIRMPVGATGIRPPSEMFNPGKRLMKRRTPLADRLSGGRRQRILIVAREPSAAMQLEELFYDAGYVTLGPVASAVMALDKLKRMGTDLVVMDADGECGDVAAILREAQRRPLPVVLIGSARSFAQVPAEFADIPRFLKPLRTDQLLGGVARAIVGASPRDAADAGQID